MTITISFFHHPLSGWFTRQQKSLHRFDASSLITKGTTPHEFTDSGINFIKMDSLKGTTIDNTKVGYISSEVHEGYLKRSILKENDIFVFVFLNLRLLLL